MTLSRSRSPRFDRNISASGLDEEKYRWRDRGGNPERGREGEDGSRRIREDGSREFGRSSKRPRVDHSREREAGRPYLPSKDRESDRPSQPHRHRHRHRDEHPHRRRGGHSPRRESAEPAASRKELPFDARQLSRSDLAAFKPLFADYLDLQKQIDISSLDDTELRGRWKSFLGKWNRGELAEGWYDPEVFRRAASEYQDMGQQPGPPETLTRSLSPANPESGPRHQDNHQEEEEEEDDNDDDDTYGPPPPPLPGQNHHHHHPTPSRHPSSTTTTTTSSTTKPPGPSIPTLTDLTLRDERLALDRAADRAAALTTHRLARRAHTREQKALLDEVAPRADAGTRERRLENKRALNDKMRGFRERDADGGIGEGMAEGELMGEGDGGGVEEYKRMVTRQAERKRERVSRREEEERARRVEREERVREYREREERVVEGLRALARARFGGAVGGGEGGGAGGGG